MKIRKFAAALLALVLCLSLSLPAAFAEAQQRVELKNLTVNVKCTGNAIPDEQLTIRLTPRKKAPMPGDAAALEAFVNTADCTRSNGYMTTATFRRHSSSRPPVPMSTRWPSRKAAPSTALTTPAPWCSVSP